jgi:hypothetical protein
VAALEEAGIEYDVVPIDFGAGEHKSPDHLARNVRIYTLSPPRTPPYLLSTCF